MNEVREATREGDAFFRLARSRSALLVIDMQNAFLEPGAMLEVAAGRDIIPKITSLITHCRNLNLPIVWVQLDSSAPYGGGEISSLTG